MTDRYFKKDDIVIVPTISSLLLFIFKSANKQLSDNANIAPLTTMQWSATSKLDNLSCLDTNCYLMSKVWTFELVTASLLIKWSWFLHTKVI